MAIHIRRREFVFTLGGAAVAWHRVAQILITANAAGAGQRCG